MAVLPFTRYTTHMGTSGIKLNLLVAGIATCAFWLFGYDMSVMVRSNVFLDPLPNEYLDMAWHGTRHGTALLTTYGCTGRPDHRGYLYNCLSRDEQRQCSGYCDCLL